MNPRLGIAFAALLLVSPSAAASEVCILFVEQHLDDPSWEQACLEWMASHEQSVPSASNAQAMESGAASASSVTVRHASASNPTLAADNQNEAFIAVDPSPVGAGRAFVISRTAPFAPLSQQRLFAAYSTDYGTTWTPTTIALDPDGPIPPGRGDPWAVFSDTGKLFISYLGRPSATFGIPSGGRPTVVAMSDDGGASFELVEVLHADDDSDHTDRGSIAVGPAPPGSSAEGSLWVTYIDQSTDPQRIVARGAALDASGDPIVDFCGAGTGVFGVTQVVAETNAEGVHPGHIAVGPSGKVLITYHRFASQVGPTDLFAVLDADGLGCTSTTLSTSPVPGRGV